MDTKNIGYIICETGITMDPTKFRIVKESDDEVPKGLDGEYPGKKPRVVAECLCQTADEVNRNHRIYPYNELIPQLTSPRTTELLNAGYLRAECGHPQSTDLGRQQNIDGKLCCARFLKLWNEGPNVMAHVKGTNNALGDEFDLDLREGCLPAWSLRALGTVENTSKGAEVHNLKLITYDNVIYPSHPNAYTRKIVDESAQIEELGDYTRIVPERPLNESAGSDYMYDKGIFVPINTESVTRYIKAESANLKTVLESMDTLFESIIPINNCTQVQMVDHAGNTIIINLESYIHNEIMSYCESRF